MPGMPDFQRQGLVFTGFHRVSPVLLIFTGFSRRSISISICQGAPLLGAVLVVMPIDVASTMLLCYAMAPCAMAPCVWLQARR